MGLVEQGLSPYDVMSVRSREFDEAFETADAEAKKRGVGSRAEQQK